MYSAGRGVNMARAKRFALFGATTTCAAMVAAYLPHTVFLYKYKEIVAVHKDEQMVEVGDNVKSLWDECLEDLKIPEHEKDHVKPFLVANFDTFHAGFTESIYGAIIGIPEYISFDDEFQIDLDKILINRESVIWERDDADSMIDSLLLSKNAKKFAIANEILLSRNYGPLINTVITPFIMIFTYAMCFLNNDHFKLDHKPKIVKHFLYGVTYLFGFGLWCMQRDLLNEYYVKDAQKKIGELGPEYVEGGREYYSKVLQRNVVLRKVMGDIGRRKFTNDGNRIHSIRREVPLTYRKSYFEQFVMENPAC